MIKVIAFDFVGVLVSEKDINLSNIEEKLERMFGPNKNDEDYLVEAQKIVGKDVPIMSITEGVIDKLYEVRDIDIFKKLKKKYPNIKIIIATNHLSIVRKFIINVFDTNYLDDLVISADIHKIKPDASFYNEVLDKYKINPNELLFIDDNMENIGGAKNVGISTIKVDKNTDIIKEISLIIDNN